MYESVNDKLFFIDTITDYDVAGNLNKIVHILCTDGCMSFTFNDTHYNVSRGDYVILPNMLFASDFSESADCHAIIMSLSESFVASVGTRSNYGVIGHLSLLQNPVMKLSDADFAKCRTDLLRLRERLQDNGHLFHEEMIGHLLMAHVLDLYDIHARNKAFMLLSEHVSSIVRQFIELLYKGEYLKNRNLSHYASMLCITPHYLTEICKKASGRSASYWIDRFTTQEISRLLCTKGLTLADIAERLNFSSVSYLSRYVQKQLGSYPTAYRDNLLKNNKIKTNG